MGDKNKTRQQSFPLMIKTGIETAIKNLHTCMPGIVEEFDPVTQFAKVNPAIKRIKQDGSEIEIPLIINAPVYFMRAGTFSITHPIEKGDECWIHFSERSLDAWKKFGEIRRPADVRFHDYSDGFIVPCVTSQTKKIDTFDNENVVIKNDAVTIVLKADNTVEVTATTMNFVGDVNITGNVVATGDVTGENVVGNTEVTAGTVTLTGHTHPYVDTPVGPSTTNPPTPGT